MSDLSVAIGALRLKNPVICASGEHTLGESGIRAAMRAGASVVVAKSINESAAARKQLAHTDYALFSTDWQRQARANPSVATNNLLCRSGLQPRASAEWIGAVAQLDREARAHDAYVAGSLILAQLEPALALARDYEQAGIRVLEFNIGTPYADEATHGGVSTERSAARVRELVAAMCEAVSIPVWVKLTGQSENVAALAAAARDGGAASVIMIGRALGMLPDLESMRPTLGTNLGYGGAWALPITCYWLARSRKQLGPDYPLIATNGARNGDDVARMMLAGASAVELSSAIMAGGYDVLADAIDALDRYLDTHGRSAASIVGVAADRLESFEQQPYRPDQWQTFVPPQALES